MNYGGGNFARGMLDPSGRGTGQGMSANEVAAAAFASQTVQTATLRLGGVTIGEWSNEAVIPGLSFGWAPAPRVMLAFARNRSGPLMLIDRAGHTRKIAAAKSILLPAWSADGTALTWLERRSNRRYRVVIERVTNP